MDDKPLVSILTPTNNPRFLQEAFNSLLKQTYTNWEWVLLPNGGTKIPTLEGTPPRLDAIRIFDDCADLVSPNIGFIKRRCAQLARGEIMIELDHDDFLHHLCVERVVDALRRADFCYSTFAEFKYPSWEARTYLPEWGWRYQPYEYDGNQYLMCLTHPPDPQYFLKITHGPNHVRAWRSDTYWNVGGHRSDLAVGDDYDLYCKFYCSGAMFEYIPECLYFYRWIDGENTTITRNHAIQENVAHLYEQYVFPAMMRWSKDQGLKCVDLGSAHAKPSGMIGVDIAEAPGVDVVADLSKPWPFGDSSIGLLRASDFIEHVQDKVFLINEIWRVMAPGGVVLIDVPSSDGRGAFQDPTHVSYWNENSFWYITDNFFHKYVPQIKAAFWPLKLVTGFPSEWHKVNNIPYVHAHLVTLKNGIHLPQPYPHMDIPE